LWRNHGNLHPGHSPGHVCLNLNQSNFLIASDALFVEDSELRWPDPSWAFDIKTAVKSVQKLARYDVETVICYHGGVYRHSVNRRIAELAASITS
jgi:glyoxylase-like metal-dependent hydrolase (beta-lactamase superfamily II)